MCGILVANIRLLFSQSCSLSLSNIILYYGISNVNVIAVNNMVPLYFVVVENFELCKYFKIYFVQFTRVHVEFML